MERFRRRVAVGVFATRDDADVMVGRLAALGVAHDCVLAALSDQPAAGDARCVALRVQLETLAQEQLVTRALLESAALSVELHDLDR